ncbi:hypothetical protein ACR2XM_28495, partial [Klebsiella pneumoniae]
RVDRRRAPVSVEQEKEQVSGQRDTVTSDRIEVGISFYEKLKELQGKRIQFVGTVYKYVKHARGRKGRIKGFYKEDYSVTLDKKLQKEEK